MILEKKICGICGVEKPKEAFSVRRKPKGYCWLRMECRLCENKKRKIRYKDDEQLRERKKAKSKEWSSNNRDSLLAYYKKYEVENKAKNCIRHKKKYEKNKEKLKADRRAHYRKNSAKHIATVNAYVEKNKATVRGRQRRRHHIRKLEDLEYVIKRKLRGRVNAALKNRAKKAARTMSLVGCSMDLLISHMESKFADGMSWSNFSEWHIDHIIPCAVFDLTDVDEQKKCFNYTNLQPLWAADNFKKGAKLIT